MHGRFILTTNRKPHPENLVVTWLMTSRDPKGQSRDPNTFKNRAKRLDRNQSYPRWSTEEPVSRVCSRSKVKVEGHVIRTFLWFQENQYFSQANGWIATKIAHDGPQYRPHRGCAEGQGQSQRSRDTGTYVMSRNVCYTVPSDVLSLHALSLPSTIILSFQYVSGSCYTKYLHDGISYSVIDGLVALFDVSYLR